MLFIYIIKSRKEKLTFLIKIFFIHYLFIPTKFSYFYNLQDIPIVLPANLFKSILHFPTSWMFEIKFCCSTAEVSCPVKMQMLGLCFWYESDEVDIVCNIRSYTSIITKLLNSKIWHFRQISEVFCTHQSWSRTYSTLEVDWIQITTKPLGNISKFWKFMGRPNSYWVINEETKNCIKNKTWCLANIPTCSLF